MTAPTLEHTDFTLEAGGATLACRRLDVPGRSGFRFGPALVFLHEGLGSIAQWRDFPADLAGRLGLPALVYERLGYGGSSPREGDPDPDYLAKEARIYLPELLAAAGIRRPILFGHSDGATIALLYAATWPDRPLAVVSEAAHVIIEDLSLAGIRRAREAFMTGGLESRLARHHGSKVRAMFHNWADTWLDPDLRDWHCLDLLPRIQCPVLAIQGEDDEYGTPAQLEALRDGCGARTLLLPACGHSPHLQAREEVLAAAVPFLATLAAPQPLHGAGLENSRRP